MPLIKICEEVRRRMHKYIPALPTHRKNLVVVDQDNFLESHPSGPPFEVTTTGDPKKTEV